METKVLSLANGVVEIELSGEVPPTIAGIPRVKLLHGEIGLIGVGR